MDRCSVRIQSLCATDFVTQVMGYAAKRLNSRKHSVTHGLRRGLRAVAASRLTRFMGNDKAFAPIGGLTRYLIG